MPAVSILVFPVICFLLVLGQHNNTRIQSLQKYPTVLIASFIRNKEHTLPYFLTYLEHQIYPKDRIALRFRSDHNEDRSIEITKKWIDKYKDHYHDVDFQYSEFPTHHQNESSWADWPTARFQHLISLKEDALRKAKSMWADFIFIIDADVFLTHPDTLSHLVFLQLPIVAPMLLSEGLYSNFWCGMTNDYYYQRTDEYKEIYHAEKTGNFPVPMVHSAVLINLKYKLTDFLTFDRDNLIANQQSNLLDPLCNFYSGPLDDIIIFAISANCSGLHMYVSNEKVYGYILEPLESSESIERDKIQMVNIKTTIVVDHPSGNVLLDNVFNDDVWYPERHKLSLDHIYMINLERRPERRQKMENCFRELGLETEYFPAVDGKLLDLEKIKNMGIQFLAGYEDPYHRRHMTMGEIGCFLSHYQIWEKIVQENQNEVLIMEDDIRFEPFFKERAESILEQARSIGDFDLIYLGRKRLKDEIEPYVEKTENLVYVGYSYWTLGYIITLQGAKKLLDSHPLDKLLPVDEFLPIMFNRHPNDTWAASFPTRNLKAFSAAPLILFPTHYTGDNGYISDTEDSEITSQKLGGEENEKQYKSDREALFIDDSQTILKAELRQVSKELTNTVSKHDVNEL